MELNHVETIIRKTRQHRNNRTNVFKIGANKNQVIRAVRLRSDLLV